MLICSSWCGFDGFMRVRCPGVKTCCNTDPALFDYEAEYGCSCHRMAHICNNTTCCNSSTKGIFWHDSESKGVYLFTCSLDDAQTPLGGVCVCFKDPCLFLSQVVRTLPA